MQFKRESFGKCIVDKFGDAAAISIGLAAVSVAVVAVTSMVIGEKVYRIFMRAVDEEYRLNEDVNIAETKFADKWKIDSSEAENYRAILRKAADYYRRIGDYNSANEFVAKFNAIYPKNA